MALYVGWHDGGALGAGVALLGLLLPSSMLMAAAVALLMRHRNHPWVAAALEGLKPAIVGMLFFVAWDLAPAGVRTPSMAVVAVLSFVALAWKVNPAIVVLVALGVGVGFLRTSSE
jgi:chromate transporter